MEAATTSCDRSRSTILMIEVKVNNKCLLQDLLILEATARLAGKLLAPAEGFGQGFFLPFGKKVLN